MDEESAKHQAALCARLGIEEESSYKEIKNALVAALPGCADGLAVDESEALADSIAALCGLYFDYATAWHTYLATAGGEAAAAPDHKDAPRVKAEAGAITRQFQDTLTRFAVCETYLKVVAACLDSDIDRAAARADTGHQDIPWTYDLPPQVALMTRRRNVLSDYMVRIRRAKPIVAGLETAFNALEAGLGDVQKPARVKTLLDDFTGLLRKGRYNEAATLIERAAQKDLKRLLCFDRRERKDKWALITELSGLIALCIKKRRAHLTGRGGRLFLRNWEVTLAYESMDKELTAARAFLEKYEVPEIRYRRDALDRQDEALRALGSLDDLLGLYEELLKGRFLPMKTMKEVRAFEEGTYKKVLFATGPLTRDLENLHAAVEKLAQGPDPESVPDEKLFENIKDIPAVAPGT